METTRSKAQESATLEKLAGSFEASLLSFSDCLNSFTKDRTFVDYIFLAQGPFVGIAHEAALKVAEMSCSFSQSYHTMEFRHGPKAIVGPDSLSGRAETISSAKCLPK